MKFFSLDAVLTPERVDAVVSELVDSPTDFERDEIDTLMREVLQQSHCFIDLAGKMVTFQSTSDKPDDAFGTAMAMAFVLGAKAATAAIEAYQLEVELKGG